MILNVGISMTPNVPIYMKPNLRIYITPDVRIYMNKDVCIYITPNVRIRMAFYMATNLRICMPANVRPMTPNVRPMTTNVGIAICYLLFVVCYLLFRVYCLLSTSTWSGSQFGEVVATGGWAMSQLFPNSARWRPPTSQPYPMFSPKFGSWLHLNPIFPYFLYCFLIIRYKKPYKK